MDLMLTLDPAQRPSARDLLENKTIKEMIALYRFSGSYGNKKEVLILSNIIPDQQEEIDE
jgi:hypothetical protein